ncbi:MAG: DNA integrity scanning protein DisA nucleotide-binding domain protein [Reyranella sp.]|nr:DNA integrity scanning protein DisA nucleotide-binding domain protein [Reyranella sp.]
MTLRKNSRLHDLLGPTGVLFLTDAAEAIERLLPHVEIDSWVESSWQLPEATFTSIRRTEVRIIFSIGKKGDHWAKSLTTIMRRRSVSGFPASMARTIAGRERDICHQIAERVSKVLSQKPNVLGSASLDAIRATFEESVIAAHLRQHHNFGLSVASMLDSFHKLAGQTYENRALAFGCLVQDSNGATSTGVDFLRPLLDSKKYKAMSDGFRTAYVLTSTGTLTDFIDLNRNSDNKSHGAHFFPEWAEPMSRATQSGAIGVALSRQGDVLIFESGTLRFTYRFGRWQYWNHAHLLNLLRNRARAQKVKPTQIGKVVGAVYKAALDVSFRRSGALFVILKNRKNLHKIVRHGDAFDDHGRMEIDRRFDEIFSGKTIQNLPRALVVELASVDGAIVIDNSGRLRAYGAVLEPKRRGHSRGMEGARTKAAKGASYFGLAIKVSSDGDISVFHDGEEFIKV